MPSYCEVVDGTMAVKACLKFRLQFESPVAIRFPMLCIKTRCLWLCYTFLVLITHTSSTALDLPYHPVRIVNGTNYQLAAIYQWQSEYNKLASAPIKNLKPGDHEKIHHPKIPLPAWIGAEPHYRYKVWMVRPEGLIVSRYVTRTGSIKDCLFLKNYPARNRVVDEQEIRFLAIQTGVHQWNGNTYPLYDYGLLPEPRKEQ